MGLGSLGECNARLLIRMPTHPMLLVSMRRIRPLVYGSVVDMATTTLPRARAGTLGSGLIVYLKTTLNIVQCVGELKACSSGGHGG